MTVSELMTILRDRDPDAEVYILNMDIEEYVTPYVEIEERSAGAVLIRCD
jgi:hypothetical protein